MARRKPQSIEELGPAEEQAVVKVKWGNDDSPVLIIDFGKRAGLAEQRMIDRLIKAGAVDVYPQGKRIKKFDLGEMQQAPGDIADLIVDKLERFGYYVVAKPARTDELDDVGPPKELTLTVDHYIQLLAAAIGASLPDPANFSTANAFGSPEAEDISGAIAAADQAWEHAKQKFGA